MSTSERTTRDEAADVVRALAALRERTDGVAAGAVAQDTLGDLLAEAVRLYARQSAAPFGDVALAALDTTPTEACTAAAALLRARSLTPFEFSIWFSATRT